MFPLFLSSIATERSIRLHLDWWILGRDFKSIITNSPNLFGFEELVDGFEIYTIISSYVLSHCGGFYKTPIWSHLKYFSQIPPSSQIPQSKCNLKGYWRRSEQVRKGKVQWSVIYHLSSSLPQLGDKNQVMSCNVIQYTTDNKSTLMHRAVNTTANPI